MRRHCEAQQDSGEQQQPSLSEIKTILPDPQYSHFSELDLPATGCVCK